MYSKLKLFSGRANQELALEVARHTGIPLGEVEIKKFANDNSWVKIKENVRGTNVFIIQPTCRPVNDNLMELLIMIDALRRSSAAKINCVIPYYGYARSDKKDQPRVPITAKLVADLLSTAGADRIIAMDLHSDQIQGFFNIPVDHLTSQVTFARYFREHLDLSNAVVVSPDAGGAHRARYLAERLKLGLAIGDKRRTGNNDEATVSSIIGDVKDKTVILHDDILDTGGSLTDAARTAMQYGASRVIAACVHGVLSRDAVEKINESPIEQVFITNSIPLPEANRSPKIVQISIAEMLAVAIKKIHTEESLSILFR
ncbi:MAG: ribose-phosphate pyrophosphokinase [Candidatus Cloacimonetes bacterium]|nr:ribose-phosphate pyrophosphokinase [Candidatus Cloacimonadota bacterium]